MVRMRYEDKLGKDARRGRLDGSMVETRAQHAAICPGAKGVVYVHVAGGSQGGYLVF